MDKRTYLLVHSKRQGNERIREWNREGTHLCNISAELLEDQAKEIIIDGLARECRMVPVDFLTSEEPLIIGQVVEDSDELKDYIAPDARDAATYSTLSEAVQQIRMGEAKDLSDSDFDRVVQLSDKKFEELASDSNHPQYDRALLYKKATEFIKKNSRPVGREYLISEVCNESLTAVEREFLDALCGGTPQIELFPLDDHWDENASFAKRYGHTGEVRHVADTIMGKKENGLKPGDCVVYYTSSAFEPVLESIFDESGIPYSFLSGRSIYTTETGKFIADILKWASGGFVYGDLNEVIEAPGLGVAYENEKGKKKRTGLLGRFQNSASDKENNVRWGLERYAGYIESLRNEAKSVKPEYKYAKWKEAQLNGLADFLKDLTEAFSTTSYSEVYHGILSVVKKYDKARKKDFRAEWSTLSETLYGLDETMRLLGHEDDMTVLSDRMYEIVGSLTVTDQTAGDRASFIRLDGNTPDLTSRKNAFFIGLSQEDTGSSIAESPFISDEELDNYLDSSKGYVHTAAGDMKEKQDALIKTVKQKKWDSIDISYSYYDTVQVRESQPSVIFRMLSEGHEVK